MEQPNVVECSGRTEIYAGQSRQTGEALVTLVTDNGRVEIRMPWERLSELVMVSVREIARQSWGLQQQLDKWIEAG